MYKPSYYNFVMELEDSEDKLIYNSFSNRLGVIKPGFDHLLEMSEIDPEKLDVRDKSMTLELAQDGMLVDHDMDEMKVLRYLNDSHKYSREIQALTIIPTKNCNFRCTYCYQNRDTYPDMSPEVQQAILEYIGNSVKKLKELHITWFGGEPLLNKDLVKNLSREIYELAQKNDCSCSFSIITNGYLIDDEMVKLMSGLNFDMVQLTLDGPPRIHNLRKGFGENGGDCFSRIITNAKKLVENNIKTTIRINVDQTNRDYMEELLDILAAEDLQRVKIYAAQVYPYTDACKSVENIALDEAEYSDVLFELNEMLRKKGFNIDVDKVYPKRKAHFCGADQMNSFVIDPEGLMYKCWSDFEDKSSSIGSIFGLKNGKIDRRKHAEWLTRSPFDYDECSKCKLLPLCMGGCPYLARKNGGKPQCSSTEQYVLRLVQEHYTLAKIKELCSSIVSVL